MTAYRFKIEDVTNEQEWNDNLKKSQYSTYFQSTNYLKSSSEDFFPVFIWVFENENVVGQLGLRIIKTTVRYSSPLLRKMTRLISSISSRAIWLDGPIIHVSDKNAKLEILQEIINAIKIIQEKYKLVHIEGYTPGYDLSIDNEYKKILSSNNFIIQDNYVTFILNMKKNINEIWDNMPKRLKQDINRAKRRNVIVKELVSYDELNQYIVLSEEWAKTKGIVNSTPIGEIKNFWEAFEKGVEKFFLAYQDNSLISGLRVVFFNNIVQPAEVISSYSKPTSLGGSLLTWASIEWAKSVNAEIYDFTGGKKSNSQEGAKNDIDSLLYYKSKWGGEELPQCNLLFIRKKFSYKLYLLLFNLVRKYHGFKMNRYKTHKIEKNDSENSTI